ncbi:proline-rich protein 4 [Actinidia rufa]|uniref:Proline-rich protein 4 n=1 Tax=Actinidia rufa TaxID=165716 RepID=A0A7J0F7D6_9ERIC|nr:proline-rich protein 4 [Actinidia rufa]
MGINSLCRGAFLGFWVVLLVATVFCHGDDKAVLEVLGIGECADCAVNNIETSQAFSGLKVTIDCKSEKGELKTRAAGELDKQGKFELSLPEDILENGKLKQECWAQLHSASATPCPAYNGLDSSKIVFKSESAGKHTFTTAGKLEFSPVTCIPIPKIPPKYFHHPKYGSLVPPYSPHPYFHHPKYGSLIPPYSPHPYFHHPKYGSLVPPIPPYHHP